VSSDGADDAPYVADTGAVVVAADVQVEAAGSQETTAPPTTEETTTMGDMDGTETMGDETGTETDGDGGSPGLGVVAALGALLAALGLRRARR
jgi:MYXO-CTERM domain-containing protein